MPIRIIHVDDEPPMTRLLGTVVRMRIPGAHFAGINIASEAIQTLHALKASPGSEWPDTLISDFNMPDGTGANRLTGADILGLGATLFPDARLILMSANPTADELAAVFKVTSNRAKFMPKPPDIEALIAMITG